MGGGGHQMHYVRHRRPGINMPMHTQACTHTRTRTHNVKLCSWSAYSGLSNARMEKGRLSAVWNLRALTTAAPSLSCRKEQKEVRGKKREKGGGPGQVTHPRRPANGLRSIRTDSHRKQNRCGMEYRNTLAQTLSATTDRLQWEWAFLCVSVLSNNSCKSILKAPTLCKIHFNNVFLNNNMHL